MLREDNRREKLRLSWFQLAGRSTISCIFVLITQFLLSLVPRFFPDCSLIVQFLLSVVVLLLVIGFGRWCRRLIGVSASAPALVVFNTLFVWGVYFVFVRPAVSYFVDVFVNGEMVLLFLGLYRIVSSDPGLVASEFAGTDELVETEAFASQVHDQRAILPIRVRYCKSCEAYVKGFDHHCPALGNCIGYKNHVLFMVLLFGFLATETSYLACCFQVSRKYWVLGKHIFQSDLERCLLVSTMLFSLLQVLWQVFFVMWHIYCICLNIRTDEWVNWKKYPEFCFIGQPEPGESTTVIQFRNPYDKGIVANLKEFLASQHCQISTS
ncbi:Probable protein S-acyltransferase 23 [Linum grandiflorum]